MSINSIPHVPLGRNGPSVPALGLGLMPLSYDAYGTCPSEEEALAFLDRAHALGARFWDTSDLYGNSEELIGKWFKRTGKRNDIFLATKFGFVKSANFEVDSSGKYCKEACDKSLKALGIESIDLYYMHHANPKTPIEETVRALAELQSAGKIRHIGLSAVSSTTLRRAHAIAPIAAVQSEYSPFVLDLERAVPGTHLLAICRELGVATIAAMPLGRGLLTATFARGESVGDEKDKRVLSMPRFKEENKAHNVQLVGRFQALAEKKGCTVAQLAIAWLLKQGPDVLPIPGTKRIRFLEENCAATEVVLTAEDEREVRAFVEGVEVAGGNMPKGFEHYAFVDTKEEEK